MRKIIFIIICIVFFVLNTNLKANTIKIVAKVQNEIITNIDILNEKKYLLFLNPKLNELDKERINQIAKNSLITEIIKRKELEKYNSFESSNDIINKIEKNFLRNRNIDSKSEYMQILENKKLSYDAIKKKIQTEALWNQLIYNKFSNNIRVDQDYLKQSILDQYKSNKNKYEYNLSEIFFTDNAGESLDETVERIIANINDIGFENTANLLSISDTSKNGGLIGWINELQISKDIKKNIIMLKEGEISKPIKIGGGYLLIKLNKSRELKQKINIENQLKEMVNKETNRQLNSFSNIYFKRLKKNIQIDEF